MDSGSSDFSSDNSTDSDSSSSSTLSTGNSTDSSSNSTSAGNSTDSSSNSTSSSDSTSSGGLGLPSDGLKTKNGVPFGFLPDVSAQATMAEINKAVGMSPASTYGWYAQITGDSWDGSQLLSQKQDIIDSKAVFIPAVMPTVDMSAITSDVAKQVASVLKQFTDEGVEVWLRFAHEVNYYISSGTYHGNVDSYQTAWANIAEAVKDNPKIKMFWCPNWADASSLEQWFPKDASTVDIVGMDAYPQSQQSFDDVYGSFYDAFAKKNNIPFAIGETGPGKGDDSLKEYWLKQIAEVDVQDKYPLYIAGCWFEYYKGFDFRIIMDQSSSIVAESKGEFQS
ncbi:glycoside hydrolase family 26 protein [Lentinula raphanica]|uniref:Glycoside hydrolase family 26 protein n=1 Tax=Lentinula raphanica TaxID=153919 RepID=A0AA38PB32_9AGAR|nr:glycoside hydrolase family 26 protein [Lentinula raphanica]KAJ3839647.1 glycoside hydrolase family 26 protein [Lentinula raphanica]